MKLNDFLSSLENEEPPNGMDYTLLALWIERKGNWDKAHRIVQDVPSEQGSAVHAYLHRKEGDLGNAGYWYSRAGRRRFSGSLEEEWNALAKEIARD